MWILFALTLLLLPVISHAETKIITAEGTYTMGDGETPSFAEAMALQKAKQTALEEAGTYVQSYTKVQNLNLTTEEIQTITGGVLQVEVLQKTRTLAGDGLRLSTKIRATVTTDKMEELAQRVRGKNVVGEYKELQEKYAQLNRDIEKWKQLIAQTPPSPEREEALNQIRERERIFAEVQTSEQILFRRLLSGETLVQEARNEQLMVEELIQTIVEQGHVLQLGEIKAKPLFDGTGTVKLVVPGKLKLAERVLLPALTKVTKSLEGIAFSERVQFYALKSSIPGLSFKRPSEKFSPSKEISYIEETDFLPVSLIGLTKDPEPSRYFQRRISRIVLRLDFSFQNGDSSHCLIGNKDIRLIFPINPPWKVEIAEYDIKLPKKPKSKPIFNRKKKSERFLYLSQPPGEIFTTGKENNKSVLYGGIFNYLGSDQLGSDQWLHNVPEPMEFSIQGNEFLEPNGNGWVIAVLESGSFIVETLLPEEQAKELNKVSGRMVLIKDDMNDGGKSVRCQLDTTIKKY